MGRIANIFSGWKLTVASLLGMVGSIVLPFYLQQFPASPRFVEVLKSLLFWGDPGEPSMHAPPFINFSVRNTMIAWFVINGMFAVFCLASALRPRERVAHSQPSAITVVVAILTLYCLWGTWPLLSVILRPS